MKQLPHSSPTVYEECVKTTNQAFVRIATDQAIEHASNMCRIAGGIVNINLQDNAGNSIIMKEVT